MGLEPGGLGVCGGGGEAPEGAHEVGHEAGHEAPEEGPAQRCYCKKVDENSAFCVFKTRQIGWYSNMTKPKMFGGFVLSPAPSAFPH